MAHRTISSRAVGDFDPRIEQANERTLLAWLRTSVGLMALGFVLARAGVWVRALGTGPALQTPGELGWIGIGCVGLGTLFAALAAVQYLRVRRAISLGRAISPSVLAPLLALLLVLVGAALVVALALD